MSQIIQQLRQYGVVPVIAIEKIEYALPLADALISGGLPVAEITFRTEAAGDVMELLQKERPELILGAGTVLTLDNLKRAIDVGAQFCVAPGTNPTVLAEAQKQGMPFVPGVCTPSDVETAMHLGCKTLKFFPAEAAGGIKMLKSLIGPYGHTGVDFIPTGGVSPTNLGDYLALPQVVACGGTWIAKGDDLAAGNWDAIVHRCQKATKHRNG